jgi:hypothetical protein
MSNLKQNTRNTEKIAGIFAILAGLSLIATILTRFEFISFFSSFSEDLDYLFDNLFLVRLNSIIWMNTALILTISASTFIVLLNPYHKLFSWLIGFFLILAAAMICVSGIKGFSIIDIVRNFKELNLSGSDALNISIFALSREKEIYIVTAYTLLGLAFFSIGMFAFRTKKLSYITGIISTITGIILPVFTSFIPEGLMADIGLLIGCITFMIIGVRLLFRGLEKVSKRAEKKQSKEKENI